MIKIDKLRECFAKHQIDAMLVTSPYNRRYITNFTGSAGSALITETDSLFITDFRYTEQASSQAKGYDIIQHNGPIINEIAKQVEKLGIRKLGFEQDYVTFAEYQSYQKILKAELIPVSRLIENLRLTKSEEEIKILKVAAEIADATFKHTLDYLKPGVSELDVANEMEYFMRKAGATSSSFDTIVASGKRSALPHGVASNKVIEKGDFVTLDFGALYNGYVSDITRTVAVGEPSEKLKEIYQIVLEAQLQAMDQLTSGMTGVEADAIARDYITEKGYGDHFGHSLGHGIGLEVHEGPSLSTRSKTELKPGMVVTVEPGIYLQGIGGVRIEDDTIIKDTGNEPLTHSPKGLIIL